MSDYCPLEHGGSIDPLLELAIRASQAAGSIIRNGHNQIQEIEQKGVGDLVSEVDRDADRAVCEILQTESDFAILSEELNADAPVVDDMWIVDPLDATGAFLVGAGPQFPSVLIALRQNGKTEIGVVYFPLTDEWFYAKRGRGAWNNGKRVVCDTVRSLDKVWVEMNHYGDAEYETTFFADLRSRLRSAKGAQMVTSNLPYSGVAMRIATGDTMLAAAVHDNNPALTKQAAWDVASPQIILEEAGGVFLNPNGQQSDPFTTEPIIVAQSRELAMQIIELAKERTTSE